MPRYFNTTGPCDAVRHYLLPPEARLPDLGRLIDRQQYFVLHAARQTGKTTAMRAFAERLRAQGYVAAWCTLETSQGVEAPAEAEPLWIRAVENGTRWVLPEADRPGPTVGAPVGSRFHDFLAAWAAKVGERGIVLLLDEADVVGGAAMVSLLRQLRVGFMDRGPGRFPTSVGLIGMRDLRDYLTQAKDGAPLNPGSPFNVKAASMTLRGFTEAEVEALYRQHTEETGQAFEPAAVARAWWWTRGQPFLVNALADLAVTELATDRAVPVSAADVDEATERLTRSRTTHLDSLGQRLKEPRVARIVQAVVVGDSPLAIPYDHDDFQYVVDLGLVVRAPGGAEPANPLYREVLARELAYNVQEGVPAPTWRWRTPDGRLNFSALVDAFLAWWRENADELTRHLPDYPEIVPHISFMGFLQRVVNGGGRVTREFAAGRGAVDLVVEFGPDRFVVELKRVRPRDARGAVRAAGLAQLRAYLDTIGADEGWLLLFDQHPGLSWEQRLWDEEVVVEGRTIRLRGG